MWSCIGQELASQSPNTKKKKIRENLPNKYSVGIRRRIDEERCMVLHLYESSDLAFQRVMQAGNSQGWSCSDVVGEFAWFPGLEVHDSSKRPFFQEDCRHLMNLVSLFVRMKIKLQPRCPICRLFQKQVCSSHTDGFQLQPWTPLCVTVGWCHLSAPVHKAIVLDIIPDKDIYGLALHILICACYNWIRIYFNFSR